MSKKLVYLFLLWAFLIPPQVKAVPILQLGVRTSQGGYGSGEYADYLDWNNPYEEDTARTVGNVILAAGNYGKTCNGNCNKGEICNSGTCNGKTCDKEIIWIGGKCEGTDCTEFKDWTGFGFPDEFDGKGALLFVSVYLKSGSVDDLDTSFTISVDGGSEQEAIFSTNDINSLSWLPPAVLNHDPVKLANAYLFFDIGDFRREQKGMPNFATEEINDNVWGEIKEIELHYLQNQDYQISWAHFDLLAIITTSKGSSIKCAPFSHDVTYVVPEPSSVLLLGFGLLGARLLKRRKVRRLD